MPPRIALAVMRVCRTMREDVHAAWPIGLKQHVQLTNVTLRTCAEARTELVGLRKKRRNAYSIYGPATLVTIDASIEAERRASQLHAIEKHLKNMFRGKGDDVFENTVEQSQWCV